MRIISVDAEPIAAISGLNALGDGAIETQIIPVVRVRAAGLPAALEALVIAGDLQAREAADAAPGRLVGELIARRLVDLARAGVLPDPARTGVLLAGDLYTVPDLHRRGGSGDVLPVWAAFASRFRWVAGVVGNHDELDAASLPPSATGIASALLDGSTIRLDGLRIGGVGGIVGKPSRLHRKSLGTFLGLFERVFKEGVDGVVCHEGPSAPDRLGNRELREMLERRGLAIAGDQPLVCCGHAWWPEVMIELYGGIQVVKADARVVVLTRANE